MEPNPLQNKKPISIIYLAALAGIGPFSTDIYLSSMPTIKHNFQASAAEIQLTLSLFLVGLAIAQLFWGPLCDKIGRKSTNLIGIIIFIISSLVCAFSENITALILGRVFQALGTCACSVSSMAMVRDVFSESGAMSKVLSQLMGIVIIAPMIAPTIGGYLLVHINWQSNFYFLTFYGLALLITTLFVPETHPKASRRPLPARQILQAYWQQTAFAPFLLAILAASTNFSVLFAFISSSPFIYISHYHLEPELFGYFYFINGCALILGTQSLTQLKKRVSDIRVIQIALTISFTGIAMMFIALLLFPETIWSIALPMLFITYGTGILFPELTGHALTQVIHYSGLASALAGTMRFVLAGIVSFLLADILIYSTFSMVFAMLMLNIITGGLMYSYFKKKATHLTGA
ncbi:MAG: multidrug transporter [Gammaproteobacteria bacterium]|jgi:DHA1 family bicyclomycin/chloramphenicol resistance-like MFS transporter|nr:multidrug transporter [Gammaproteobacteria bacterium]